jgi:hypothetical protein
MDKEYFDKLIEKLDDLNNNFANTYLYDFPVFLLGKRAVEKSADYIEENMSDAIAITTNYKYDMWNCVINKLTLDGYMAEFGVFKGTSINYLANLLNPKIIYGFDSFFGLEEDFSLDYSKGQLNANGILPKVEDNVILVQGSFSDTLPKWLTEHKGIFSFLNIDCDTYTATSTVLNCLGPERIVPGTFILFDEYLGFFGWENHEYKAWKEYCLKNNVKYRYVAVCHLQVLIEVI